MIRIGLGLVALLGFIAWASSNGTQTTQEPQGASPSHEVSPDGSFFGSADRDLADGVHLELDISLLPPLLAADGRMLRSSCVELSYEVGAVQIGEARFHQMVEVDSSTSVDLSVRDLDRALGQNADVPAFSSYHVSVSPKPGKTWGSVQSVADDILFTAQ